MRYLQLIFLCSLFISYSALSQDASEVDYCGFILTPPSECQISGEQEVNCDGYVVQWLYMNNLMLKSMPEQFIDQLEDKLKKFSKKEISCTSFDYDLEGYKISYKNKGEIYYKIIVYGVVNIQPVMLNISLSKEPKTNESLPEFIQTIFTLN
ncbi:hypothetical protein [Fulvivirga ligni]|uniref:hypothetical protein n=1 Tax=Fulvivirga ligni TaxID=2904246 RepID=UPI001F19C5FA|nr:hypothetical protein [Fulvivirga ligni]UII24084.1 hypothetical protein LVD16_12730 [Fulvivirga ligni]